MKLHTMAPSPNSIKIQMLANHLGINLEHVPVDLFAGGSKTPEFLQMNPNGRIPVLQDGDFILWESSAIMFYLAAGSGNKEVWPDDLKAQANIQRWMGWTLCHWGPCLGTLMFEKLIKGMRGEQPDMTKVEEGLANFRMHAAVLDAHLAQQPFVTGAHPGMPDFALVAPLVYAEPAGVPMAEFPHIQAWFGKLMAMPAIQKAIPPMPAAAAR